MIEPVQSTHNVTQGILNLLESTVVCLCCVIEQGIIVVQATANHGICHQQNQLVLVDKISVESINGSSTCDKTGNMSVHCIKGPRWQSGNILASHL